MSKELIQGSVSFVNHDKQYITIAYELNSKKKTINGAIDSAEKHFYQIGDVVAFVIALSGRGDKMVATEIKFRYNNALDAIINKAKTENSFLGYLKEANGKYFVKEIGSYVFFPVAISPWQFLPDATKVNEAVAFSLEHIEKKEKAIAKLFDNKYIPEFNTAIKYSKAKTPIEATVFKVTLHAIYLNIVGNKIQAKLPVKENNKLKVGDTISVIISFLNTEKIVVTPA